MKITKTPKQVQVIHETVRASTDSYVCPSCSTEYRGYNIGFNVIKFKCKCGQVLIAQHIDRTF